MMRSKALALLCGLVIFNTQAIAQDDPGKLCQNAAKLFSDGDLDGAIEEAKWCVEGLEQLKQASQAEAFPKAIGDWKRGDVNTNKAMGMTVIDTTYTSGDKEISVSLTSGMEGFGALAQMGMASAGTKVRIQKKTAVILGETAQPEMMISLEGGKLLKFEARSASQDEMVELAKKLPLEQFE